MKIKPKKLSFTKLLRRLIPVHFLLDSTGKPWIQQQQITVYSLAMALLQLVIGTFLRKVPNYGPIYELSTMKFMAWIITGYIERREVRERIDCWKGTAPKLFGQSSLFIVCVPYYYRPHQPRWQKGKAPQCTHVVTEQCSHWKGAHFHNAENMICIWTIHLQRHSIGQRVSLGDIDLFYSRYNADNISRYSI